MRRDAVYAGAYRQDGLELEVKWPTVYPDVHSFGKFLYDPDALPILARKYLTYTQQSRRGIALLSKNPGEPILHWLFVAQGANNLLVLHGDDW